MLIENALGLAALAAAVAGMVTWCWCDWLKPRYGTSIHVHDGGIIWIPESTTITNLYMYGGSTMLQSRPTPEIFWPDKKAKADRKRQRRASRKVKP